jgi:hypothetical protein
MRSLLALLVIALSGAMGCAGASMEALRRRASFDFNCAENKLEVVEIDGRTRGVSGCGQRATYVEDCRSVSTTMANGQLMSSSTGKTDCTWMMNTDARPTPSPAPAPGS